ncbi:hypothetical protein EPA93_42235 [Ktedonosporobacter rubrisoli]|uniref:Baseplate protein J-like barrel domain-containing protein n=1 Tax=Ktedonosporobacter rubrisoli TaxID=2509675 RepID=A0A4P6K292_KTERU|nr:baseplate J/gp47 family protein [Ktedonosporobacter rubrisoli]QBD82249.1 hypothetical protein EPA93_42235 [Ktedonosporobacter rubrisoli]
MNNPLRNQIDRILAHLETTETTRTTDEYQVNEPTRVIDIHVYDLEAETVSAESDSIPDQILDQQEHQQHQASSFRFRNVGKWGRSHLRLLLLAVLLLLILMLSALMLYQFWYAPAATVTLIPASQELMLTTTLDITTEKADARTSVPGRLLPAVTMSQFQTIRATGVAHQQAQASHGTITFYNAAPAQQVIPAGTLLTGADGVQVVTDESALVPPVSYPTLGQARVSAHAVTTGSGGNIKAGDIYGPCCRLNISAVNSAFSGGQNERSYPIVTHQDIERAATMLQTRLQQSMQAALQTQVDVTETLITPLSCHSGISSDHQGGEEAKEAHITVSETCSGIAYTTASVLHLIQQRMQQQAEKQLGKGYTSAAMLHTRIAGVSRVNETLTRLQVGATDTWAYQFTQADQEHIKQLIVGERKQDATNRLLHIPGIQSVSLEVKNSSTLPTDVHAIHLVFIRTMRNTT